MKQQVVAIHGGGSFIPLHGESILDIIKNKEPDLERMRHTGDWKKALHHTLGETYDVLLPRMPNSDAPLFEEWSTWFEKIVPLLDANAIYIGHSLGGIFLAKYFSECTPKNTVPALFIVAAPYGPLGFDWELRSISKLSEHVEHIFMYQSTDDTVVDFADFEKYKEALPTAITRTFNDRGHFNQETFPELVTDITSLSGVAK